MKKIVIFIVVALTILVVCIELLRTGFYSKEELSKEERTQILDVLNTRVSIDNAEHTVKNAIEIMVKSFSSSCNSLDFTKLLLPELKQYNEIYENNGDV